MIDTPVFGFFHRARPPSAQSHTTQTGPEPTGGRQAVSPQPCQAPTPSSEQAPSPVPPAKTLPLRRPAAPILAEVFTTGSVAAESLGADQLGLAHPLAITLFAHLEGADAFELDATATGIYRPIVTHPAPWSGYAYDDADNARIGLASGTRILTARGEVEVERLLPGDTALGLRGPALLPIAWIGRTVTVEHSVCIDAGALGPGLPRRTLCVAADQPIFVEAVPVAARTLLNGSTIRSSGHEGIDMFHIDVGRSEILFVEGLPLSSGERAEPQRDAQQPLP